MAQVRTKEKFSDKRAAILSAAERIFAESGLAGARTDAIVREAGVNKALLYYYFKSKAKLYEAVIEDHFREFNQQALELLTKPGSARSILLEYVGLHFDFISSHHRYAALHQQMMTVGDNTLERVVREHLLPRSRALGRLLDRGMREGVFRRASVLHSGVSITALIVFYFAASRVLPILGHTDAYTPANLKRRKEEVLDFIRHALFVDPNAL